MLQSGVSNLFHPQRERIFDLYLFINPLGEHCYHCEKEILSLVRESDSKIHYQFVPFVSIRSISQYMRSVGLNEKDLTLRNQVSAHIYDACLAYKAALLQGKRAGRQFLIELQKQIHKAQVPYSENLLKTVSKKVGLDQAMFLEDKNSDFIKKDFEKDQKMAREMFVSSSPSLVIFDNSPQDHGILLQDTITCECLMSLINGNTMPKCCSKKADQTSSPCNKVIPFKQA